LLSAVASLQQLDTSDSSNDSGANAEKLFGSVAGFDDDGSFLCCECSSRNGCCGKRKRSKGTSDLSQML
jgi:hypothetical protein